MDMELVSRETIKPNAPTPPHLKVHPLSFIDHVIPRNYVPVIFFYHPNQVCNNQATKILMLKKSLPKVLSRYYPFAGRFKDQLSIDCNDQGVLLLVTSIKCKLTQILHNPTESVLSPLFPEELQWRQMKSSSESMLAIQINGFACGGIAISVCLSHKAGDASTLFKFVNDWATINRDPPNVETELPFPVLDAGASVFSHDRNLPVFPEVKLVNDGEVCKRFVFEGSTIESLKAMVSSQNVQNPTRVEIVTALIFKCFLHSLGLSFKTTSFCIYLNLRNRMVPPLPENSTGNLFWLSLVSNPFMEEEEENDEEVELYGLVREMKRALSEFSDTYPIRFAGKEKDLTFISECLQIASTALSFGGFENQILSFSSWCRFPVYEADFGWGKPLWVTTSGSPARNYVFCIDTRDGKGIEAYVSLKEQDMAKFESHAELLQYASLNPTVGDADWV